MENIKSNYKSLTINLIARGKLYIRGQEIEKGDKIYWLHENIGECNFDIESFYFDELHIDYEGFSFYRTKE